MIPVTTFKGKSVALFGLGGSGLATALALHLGSPPIPRRGGKASPKLWLVSGQVSTASEVALCSLMPRGVRH